MELDATIFIKTPSNWDPRKSEGWENFPYHPSIGSRFFAGVGGSSVEIYGRTLSRTWTLLSEDHSKSDSILKLKHDADEMNWRVGDKIAIATTNRGSSSEHTITEINNNRVTVDPPLPRNYMGGVKQVYGVAVEKAAEVINLSRNVKITGDTDTFHSMKQVSREIKEENIIRIFTKFREKIIYKKTIIVRKILKFRFYPLFT